MRDAFLGEQLGEGGVAGDERGEQGAVHDFRGWVAGNGGYGQVILFVSGGADKRCSEL